MTRKFFLVVLLTVILSTLPFTQVQAQNELKEELPTQQMSIIAAPVDPRVLVLQDYLNKHKSPLAANAQDFVEAADTYNMDWRLVPAIAGVESTFGKRIPGGYNAWGWGVYGDKSLGFGSWKDGIYTVSKGLKENYIDDGLTTVPAIGRRYASSTHWPNSVNFFLNDIEKYYQANKPAEVTEVALIEVTPMAPSARLVSY